jgi:O-antigen ligase
MKRRPIVTLIISLLLLLTAILGAAQWRARERFLTQGWTVDFPEPVADTPGATGTTQSRACVNAPLESYAEAELAWALDAIEAGGFAWVRQRISWADAEVEPGIPDWSRLDALFEALSERPLELIAVLDDAPAWARAPGGGPPDPVAYAEWAGAAAERYGDTITYYQIWHNPNLGDSWGGRANAFEYADLLARAAGAIRAADGDARIVLGALAPTSERGQQNYAEDLFLEMLYEAGAAPNFDVVSVQPYGFDTGPVDRRVAQDVLNFSRPILVRQAMVARGEGDKAIWAANFGWNSMREGCWPGGPSIWGSVSEADQASYTVTALERVEREWPWMGVLCLNSFQPQPGVGDLALPDAAASGVPDAAASGVPDAAASGVPDAEEHWGFALMTPEGEPRPVYEAVRMWAAAAAQAAHAGVYRADTDLATFDGAWTLGPQGADIGEHGKNTVSFTFEGTGVALTVRRGPYRAFLFVTVDGEPAPALPHDRDGRAYAVLFDPLAEVATLPLAEGLTPGLHTVEIEAERGWGQWALADWRVVDAPGAAATRRWGYLLFGVLGLLGIAGVVVSLPRIEVKALARRLQDAWDRLAQWLQMLVSSVAAAIALFSAWQMLMGEALFRRLGEYGDFVALVLATGLFYVSPWLILTLIAGLLMSLIVVLRPSLGLALVIFAAPLYAYPLSLGGRAFALAELVLLPTLVGWALRWLGTITRERWSLRDFFSDGAHGLGVCGRGARALLRPLLALVAISIVSSFGVEHLREALRELRLVVVEPTLFFVALVTLPMAKRKRWRLLDALVAGALMVALVGLVMYFLGYVITAEGGSRRLLSVYGSPNNVGLFLGRVLPVLIAVVLWAGPELEVGLGWRARARAWLTQLLEDRRRRAYLLAIVPVALALGLSLSRGAILLGMPTALVMMGWLAGKRWRRATVVVLLVGMIALIPLLRTPRFAGMLDLGQGTTGFRVSLWYSSLGMIRDHPLLGVGLDNFLYAYRTRYVLPTAWEEFSLSHPHNVFLDYAVRLGLPGLCAFVWTQVVFWRRLLQPRRRRTPASRALAIGLAGSMADFLAHGLVDASYFIIDLAFVYMFSLGLAVWLDEGVFDN